ncbi:hypothetical protein SAMN05444165_0611 [Paraburkholderia phenazinium]|uniref:Uncharacterized protein n=1 Tax=Paraburkholderia phenazinium TaxID=60549 RepID=A0A1N6G7R6_9BURK|nr:hypothetical protein SAMN05444165_0611 [Paraburkholderia phenazinium]
MRRKRYTPIAMPHIFRIRDAVGGLALAVFFLYDAAYARPMH